jgi:ectoine hydroxylase-related dioxygenase (phytanoyl-CoA dioxygenase family)
VAVHASAGDAVFINSAIWHSGGRNRSDGLRRAIYLYYGYWWLKPYEADQQRPWQALEGAGEQRLRLLGVKMPAPDLHQY